MTDSTLESKLSAVVRIVDDEEHVRSSIAFLVQLVGLEYVLYRSAEEFLQRDDFKRPGCIILDIRMGGMNGMELHKILLSRGIDLPVLFLTGHGDIDMAVTAMKRGAAEFMQKPTDPRKLQQTVTELVARSLADRDRKTRINALRERYDRLTHREKEVIGLVARGELNKVIADRMGVSEQTVKIHRANACRKIDCRSAVEISSFLRRIGKSLPEEDQ